MMRQEDNTKEGKERKEAEMKGNLKSEQEEGEKWRPDHEGHPSNLLRKCGWRFSHVSQC